MKTDLEGTAGGPAKSLGLRLASSVAPLLFSEQLGLTQEEQGSLLKGLGSTKDQGCGMPAMLSSRQGVPGAPAGLEKDAVAPGTVLKTAGAEG